MNAPHPLHQQLSAPVSVPMVQSQDDDDQFRLVEYWNIVVDHRWLIFSIAAVALAIGIAYALLTKPIYESNLLVQVEDSQGSAKAVLGEAASLFDVKTAATAEMEILRSRMVIGRAVDDTVTYVTAMPKRPPIIGDWLARRATALSGPGFLGFGGWVTGTERIHVSAFEVPKAVEESKFTVVAQGGGAFELRHPGLPQPVRGAVGAPLSSRIAGQQLSLTISELEGEPGAEFELVRHSRLDVIGKLQGRLKLTERGRQSGVIDVSLQDTDRERLTNLLNAIGDVYVRQNVDRKGAEAQKTLNFLDVQLPQAKKQLDVAEEAYSQYRNIKGTISLDDEAKVILTRSVELQSKLVEAQQKRREMVSRFTSEHPAVRTLDEQIRAWSVEVAALNSHVKELPAVQQEALRLERDVKVNNQLYQQLRGSALTLQLVREGKTGNVRLIDPAATPETPVHPRRGMIMLLSLLGGLAAGVALSIFKSAVSRGVRGPHEVEMETGLSVYSTIPLSVSQQALASRVAQRLPGRHLLAEITPNDVAVEALRSFRTALQFAMLETSNNRVLITGGTPGIGKSFVSANFAAVLASAGKRVLLVDADLRKGHLNQYFGVDRERGLSEMISGVMPFEKAVRRGVLERLDFVSTGVLPPNPAELLVSGNFERLLVQMSAEYDIVLLDSAPILVAADTLSVAGHVGALFLVARADQTQVGDLRESARRLAQSGKKVTGVLFNGLNLTQRHFGKYGYQYGGYDYGAYAPAGSKA